VERADRVGLSGWRMVVAAGSSFLLPLVLAAVGAACLGPAGWAQVLGAVSGLALGGLLGVVVMRTFVPLEEKP
jgi:zinc transporter ZupT